MSEIYLRGPTKGSFDVSLGWGNDLVSSGKKLNSEPLLTRICVAKRRHYVTVI